MYYIEKETPDRLIIKKTSKNERTGLLYTGDTNWTISVHKASMGNRFHTVIDSKVIENEDIMSYIDNDLYYHYKNNDTLPDYVHVISKVFLTV